jgi:hypothetical protein
VAGAMASQLDHRHRELCCSVTEVEDQTVIRVMQAILLYADERMSGHAHVGKGKRRPPPTLERSPRARAARSAHTAVGPMDWADSSAGSVNRAGCTHPQR